MLLANLPNDHAVGLALSMYLAGADNVVRRILRHLLRHKPSREQLVNVSCDWGFRTAAGGLAVELIFAFRTAVTPLGRWGFLGALAGSVFLVGSFSIGVGELFEKRIEPRWFPIRLTMGRILQLWLLGIALILLIEGARSN